MSVGRGSDGVLRIQAHLTDRDHQLIEWLSEHGVLTSAQIAHALFPSADFAQRRLATLTRLGVVDRFRPLRLDGGSFPYHYVLAQLGAEVRAAQVGEDPPRPGQARARMRALTSRASLAHLLGVNQFFTDLAGHARTHPGSVLERWWPEARCARPHQFAMGVATGARPDGHGIYTDVHDGVRRRIGFFLEYDTGTEPLHRLVDKLPNYTRLIRGIGQPWPVLFWLHSATREAHLHTLLAEQRVDVAVATAARDHAAGAGASPAEQVWWLRHHPGGLFHLSDLAEDLAAGQ